MAHRELKAKDVDNLNESVSLLQSVDSDKEQGIVRLLLVGTVFVYLLFGFLGSSEYLTTSAQVMTVSTSYFVFSMLVFALSHYGYGNAKIRRVFALTVDTLVVTYALIAAGETAAPFVGALVWLPIANGIRYGRNYLYISYCLSMLGFTFALLYSPYWQEEIVLGVGLLVWTALLPIYVFKLLKRLEVALAFAGQANKSKSQFLANMSHELRTPLNAVIGYSEMLQEDASENGNEQVVSDLGKIQSAANHLLVLINDILDLSKIEAGGIKLNPEIFDVEMLMCEVIDTVKPLMDKNSNHLELNIADDVRYIKADPARLKQALINLISNAAKFTKSGVISIEVKQSLAPGNDSIIFSVKDTGVGLSQEKLDRLFQPFVQADDSTTRNYGGTGLGLAITKCFCEKMAGSISVYSEEGEGSTFTIVLPTNMDEEPTTFVTSAKDEVAKIIMAKAGSRGGDKNRKRTSTVLVVDDDHTVLDIVSRQLSKEGFNVVTADNGLDGLRIAREHKPDIITLDVMMPGMDGWSVLTTLKKDAELCDIPVVMLTMVDNAAAGYALGAADYMLKPINGKRLDSVVKKWVRHNSREPVLIVEDDPDMRAAIAMAVKNCGVDVSEASNGIEALVSIANHRPSLIITDMVMPNMNGFEFLNEIKKSPEYKDIPVVAMTGAELDIEEAEVIQRDVEEIIMKGEHNLESLVLKINEMLNKYAT